MVLTFALGVQVDEEFAKTGKSSSAYSKSTIVAASAPVELGTLRQADGDEGFATK